MKKRIIIMFVSVLIIMSFSQRDVMAAGTTKTIYMGPSQSVKISDVYSHEITTSSAADGFTTMNLVVVSKSAKIEITQLELSEYGSYYCLIPFNDITFYKGNPYPKLEHATDYDNFVYLKYKHGDKLDLAAFNEYYFDTVVMDKDENRKNYLLSIFVVDDETLVQFGGAKPSKKAYPETSNIPAKPSKTNFAVEEKIKGKLIDSVVNKEKFVTQAYTISNTNYLQLRAIAVLLNKTASQFDITWDGQYAVIEPGKPYSFTVTGSKMQETKYVRKSGTKFKMNGEVFSFEDARMINGDINYIQLREFAQKLAGTESQFNVYWDANLKQAIIQPGIAYTGTKAVEPVAVLEKYSSDESILSDGDYYLQIFDKFVYPVVTGQMWIELQDNVPREAFTIKLAENDEKRGPKYSIACGDVYIMLPGSIKNGQLQATSSKTPHYWRINKYSKFITIRDYLNQRLIVSTRDNSSDSGASIIGSSSQGSAPENAKIVLYKDAYVNGEKTLMYIKQTPVKTSYKVGEAFDSTGINVTIVEAGVERNISDEISFHAEDIADLTDAYKFTSYGQKTVKLRYNGISYGEYIITITD